METTQGNSLCSYLYLKLAKTLCFSFMFFSSTKLENRKVKLVLLLEAGGGTSGRVRWQGKG
jgi:hypothetical protein